MRPRENDKEKGKGKAPKKFGTPRKKICRMCADPQFVLDYKEPKLLGVFVSERGKLVPSRLTGNCAFHQRRVAEAVKRARTLALLPYSATHQ